MNLLDIVKRPMPPVPWSEGDNIPWHDPAFSARMLAEHLSQEHDAASRRAGSIDAHVRWIHERLLHGRPARILDLGCGPGLYATRLAALGHTCRGIDYAPASIEYARSIAGEARLPCTYELADIRTASFGHDFTLVMLIYGELNAFRPADARAILVKARSALAEGGLLLLEVHTEAAVRRLGHTPPTWRSAAHGLFSDRPHLRLDESFFDEENQAATLRYLVIDAESAIVDWYAQSIQAYSVEAYRSLVEESGFVIEEVVPALDGTDASGNFIVLICRMAAVALPDAQQP
jgi:SAM-dependent methyltransferase